MFSARRIAIVVPILVIAGIAGQTVFSSKTSGDMVAAHWDAVPSGGVHVVPADTPDGRAYSVFWQGCTLNPDFEHRFCMFAGGLAPKSAIKAQQVDTLGLNLDISMLSVVFAVGGVDCRSGTCIPFVPASVPLNGTFTVYRGPGSFSAQSNGSSRRDDLLFGGFTMSQAFTGSRAESSANFAGVVGPLTVTPGPVGSNAFLTIMKGQQTFQTVYPSTP